MKKTIRFRTLLLMIGLLPVIISISTCTFISVSKLSQSLEADVYSQLLTATIGLRDYYGYDVREYGYIDTTDTYIDTLKQNGIELTLFENDTRVVTSIYKEGTSERNIGTTADYEIYNLVKSGQTVERKGVVISGSKYYVTYIPIYDGDGNFWGMAFAGQSQQSVNKTVTDARNVLLFVSGVMLILSVVITLIISNSIKKPLISASVALNVLSEGDLSEQETITSSVTEIDTIIKATANLQSALQSAINSVKQSESALAIAVSEVDKAVDDTANEVAQINGAINEVSITSQSVAESAQTLTGKADELGASVEALSNNVTVLTESSTAIKQANEEAMEYMNIVLESSAKSVQSVTDIAQTIANTNEAVADIQSCVSVINDIASETKLLSLNASIEAARAGEAGRGFSVVAENIKSLAESSADNVKKIADIIDRVTKLSAQSVSGAESVTELINAEKQYIIDAQTRFTTLSNAVDSSIDEIQSISNKTVQLDALKSTLISETSDLSAISEELGASAEEVSANCTTVSGVCQQSHSQTQEMQSLNMQLSDAVEFFK